MEMNDTQESRIKRSSESMSITVRQATAADTSAIVKLLKKSLGETTVEKSERLWTWKHLENPFGESLVLVAEAQEGIVGVRAFMRWNFQRRGKLYKSLRAVDTATDPAYMGKGIFKKLTMRLVEQCRDSGFDFIYNTPNEKSRPGYLKMGWIQQGKLPLQLRIVNPFTWPISLLLGRRGEKPEVPHQKWTSEVFQIAATGSIDTDKVNTQLSPDYLSWRYGNNPLLKYNYVTDGNGVLLIYRIKDGKFGREMRIADVLLPDDKVRHREALKFLRAEVDELTSTLKVDFISGSGLQLKSSVLSRWSFGLLPVINAGPIVTFRNLNMPSDFLRFISHRYWNFSLGDLELF